MLRTGIFAIFDCDGGGRGEKETCFLGLGVEDVKTRDGRRL